nr:hypothetical protein CFP56_71342 [Quercus suber]
MRSVMHVIMDGGLVVRASERSRGDEIDKIKLDILLTPHSELLQNTDVDQLILEHGRNISDSNTDIPGSIMIRQQRPMNGNSTKEALGSPTFIDSESTSLSLVGFGRRMCGRAFSLVSQGLRRGYARPEYLCMPVSSRLKHSWQVQGTHRTHLRTELLCVSPISSIARILLTRKAKADPHPILTMSEPARSRESRNSDDHSGDSENEQQAVTAQIFKVDPVDLVKVPSSGQIVKLDRQGRKEAREEAEKRRSSE